MAADKLRLSPSIGRQFGRLASALHAAMKASEDVYTPRRITPDSDRNLSSNQTRPR
jgi:hypothetical protein